MVEGETWTLEDRIEDIAKRFEKLAEQMEEQRLWHERRERERLIEERRQARRQAMVDRRKSVEKALREVVQQVRLVEDAQATARFLVELHPDSKWAKALAKWMQRAATKLASPPRIVRYVPVETWAALGMPTRTRDAQHGG